MKNIKIILIIILTLSLTGCQIVSEQINPLYGTYEGQTIFGPMTVVISSNNRLSVDTVFGKTLYEIQSQTADELIVKNLENDEVETFEFKIIGDYEGIVLDGTSFYK